MTPLLLAGAAALLAGAVGAVALLRNRLQDRSVLRALAQQLGLDVAGRETLRGTRDGVPYRLHVPSAGVLQAFVGDFDTSVTLRRQGLAANLGKAFDGAQDEAARERSDLTIGVEPFDSSAIVRGPEPVLRAALDAPTRECISRVLQRGGSVEGGQIRFRGLSPTDPKSIDRTIDELVAAARSFDAKSVHERLSRQARLDPEPDVRLRCLRCAIAELPKRELDGLLRAAMRDEDWRISVLAAETLGGEEGRATLLAAIEDDTAPDPPRLLALDAFRRTSPLEVVLPLLRAHVGDISTDVRKKVQEWLGRLKDREAIPLLLERIEKAAGWEKASIATALGLLGDPSALRALRALLADATAGPAAVEALAALGELEDVAMLRAWASAPGRSRVDAATALGAIALIQTRLGGESGGLAIAGDTVEAGALSVAGAEAGSLSEIRPPPKKQPT